MDPLEQLQLGAAHIVSVEELNRKLESKKPLRVKLGVDPTAPDIHLGHSLPLRKLRQFQDLGHHGVLIIGDFTAMIGDPTGRSATRPALTRDEIMANAETYTTQAFKILDRDKTEIVYNGSWFHEMHYSEVIKLNGRVTLQQMLQREDFRNRIDNTQEVRLHEIQYPIMQGWDSVMVRSDVELGGTDQLFNNLVGRDMQKSEGMDPQVVLVTPILEGLDGVKKMSKSLNNYVAFNDSPDDMFGKLMSVSDELMDRYYVLLLGEKRDPTIHPKDAKIALARKVTSVYHGSSAAENARENFHARFAGGGDAEWPTFAPSGGRRDLLGLVAEAFVVAYDARRSNGDVRRLITQGAVQVNGEKMTDPKAEPPLQVGDVLRLDKKRSVTIAE